jgi:D-alanine-D-alanine ligase
MHSKPINKEAVIAKLGHVAVLMGGNSSEREISLLSGSAVLEGLLRLGVNCTGIDVSKNLYAAIASAKPDWVFNMLHGQGGEDGVLQGFLETLNIPYSGSGVLSSALAMDKVRSKLIWLQLGLRTAEFVQLSNATDWQEVIGRFERVVVKPTNGGSSLGIAICDTAEALKHQYEQALKLDAHVFAEKHIAGREFSTTIIGDTVFPTIQLETEREFFDFDAKYIDTGTRVICPPEISKSELEEIEHLALSAYQSLGCRGVARVDVMQSAQKEFFLLEVNTVPGMTSHSFVPAAAKAAGMDFDELLLFILDHELTAMEARL